MSGNTKPVLFDVTRLVRRGHFPAPTGIDRIERKYTDFLLGLSNRDVEFQAWLPMAGWCTLPRNLVETLSADCDLRWNMGGASSTIWHTIVKIPTINIIRRPVSVSPAVRLTVAHNRPEALRQWHRDAQSHGDKICYFVHDLIPVEYPQFARPRHATVNRVRMTEAARLSDALIVNSHATRASLEQFMHGARKQPPIVVAPFGPTLFGPTLGSVNDKAADVRPFQVRQPYFMCIGTIEPRKNHRMLLEIWRNMAALMPKGAIPTLIIAGRRGWENSVTFALLEQCRAEGLPVTELNDLSDGEMHLMMRGACAVLMPSHAEGYGLPVTEGLGAHCPVIASDIAAHREVGGAAPLYLAASDIRGWQKAILDFASAGSEVRRQYKQAAENWRPFEWSAHFAAVMNIMDQL